MEPGGRRGGWASAWRSSLRSRVRAPPQRARAATEASANDRLGVLRLARAKRSARLLHLPRALDRFRKGSRRKPPPARRGRDGEVPAAQAAPRAGGEGREEW